MASFDAMKRCAAITISDPDKKIIVVSATSGTTNQLTKLIDAVDAADEGEKKELIAVIRSRHIEICKSLVESERAINAVSSLVDELKSIALSARTVTPQIRDQILSYGEMLSSVIFSQVLFEQGDGKDKSDKIEWLDARDVIITDHTHSNAEPDVDAIEKRAEEMLVSKFENRRFVTQGFIGKTAAGTTTTIGRGGSDYSAALFAEAINADVLEIWTDVTAVYTTDPRIVAEARPITEISFAEAAELSVFGAKVLHPATLVPAIRKNIKVYVGSSIYPDKPGTWILKETRSKPVIRAISLRRNQTLFTVHSLDMLHRYGFLAKLFEVLAKHKISVDLVTTSEVSVSLTLDTDINAPGRNLLNEEVIKELKTFCEVEIQKNLSLVALVGNNLHATSGLSGPVFGALKDINIRLICHGASSHNMCFLVDEGSAENVVQILHEMFITKSNT